MRLFRVELTSLGLFFLMVLGLLVFGLQGCAGLGQHGSQADDRCRNLESRYQLWGAVSIASTALAGSGALTTPVPEDKGARFAIGISAASLIALGAASLFVRDDVLSLYAAECETSSVSEPRDP